MYRIPDLVPSRLEVTQESAGLGWQDKIGRDNRLVRPHSFRVPYLFVTRCVD